MKTNWKPPIPFWVQYRREHFPRMDPRKFWNYPYRRRRKIR